MQINLVLVSLKIPGEQEEEFFIRSYETTMMSHHFG
jgi:hypothetical protein